MLNRSWWLRFAFHLSTIVISIWNQRYGYYWEPFLISVWLHCRMHNSLLVPCMNKGGLLWSQLTRCSVIINCVCCCAAFSAFHQKLQYGHEAFCYINSHVENIFWQENCKGHMDQVHAWSGLETCRFTLVLILVILRTPFLWSDLDFTQKSPIWLRVVTPSFSDKHFLD